MKSETILLRHASKKRGDALCLLDSPSLIYDLMLIFTPKILRPIARLGGVSYARTTEAFELLRPDFKKDLGGYEGAEKLKKKDAELPN